jgi:hypothetical protein
MPTRSLAVARSSKQVMEDPFERFRGKFSVPIYAGDPRVLGDTGHVVAGKSLGLNLTITGHYV